MFGFKTKALAAAEIAETIQTFEVVAGFHGTKARTAYVTAVHEGDALMAVHEDPTKWFHAAPDAVLEITPVAA